MWVLVVICQATTCFHVQGADSVFAFRRACDHAAVTIAAALNPGIAQIITSLAGFIAAAGTFVLALKSLQKIEQVHVATNSMKDALVTATDIAAHAKGKEEGRIEGEAKAAILAEGTLAAKK